MVKRSFEEARKSPYYKAQTKTLIFISQIEDLMRNRKISKKELAERMGVSAAYISKIFNCSVNISMITMEKLANALKMEISQPKLYDTIISETKSIKSENKEIPFIYNNDNDIDLLAFKKSETNCTLQIRIS